MSAEKRISLWIEFILKKKKRKKCQPLTPFDMSCLLSQAPVWGRVKVMHDTCQTPHLIWIRSFDYKASEQFLTFQFFILPAVSMFQYQGYWDSNYQQVILLKSLFPQLTVLRQQAILSN